MKIKIINTLTEQTSIQDTSRFLVHYETLIKTFTLEYLYSNINVMFRKLAAVILMRVNRWNSCL